MDYRGKNIRTNQWIYGSHIENQGDDFIYTPSRENTISNEDGIIQIKAEKITPKTLGRYSGLNDMTGKRIYQGDIIEWKRGGRLYVVIFKSGMFFASVEECNEDIYGGFPLYALTENEETPCQIVGNIYDNQELLKK